VQMIRVALLDDHPAVLTGLVSLLEATPEIGVIAAEHDEVALARALEPSRPDVLIVDYDPARGDTLALCRRIKARPDPIRVLIYSAYASERLAIAARVVQADGVLDKAVPASELIDAILEIASGGRVFPDLSRDALVDAATGLDDADLPVLMMRLDGEPVAANAQTLRTDERDVARRLERLAGRIRPRIAAADWPHSAAGRLVR
jgi:DNA-binding NarL/FixJ family response regulator